MVDLFYFWLFNSISNMAFLYLNINRFIHQFKNRINHKPSCLNDNQCMHLIWILWWNYWGTYFLKSYELWTNNLLLVSYLFFKYSRYDYCLMAYKRMGNTTTKKIKLRYYDNGIIFICGTACSSKSQVSLKIKMPP